MKAVVTTGALQMQVLDLPTPTPGAGEALVAVEAVGLCGSDFHIFDGTHFACHYPVVQGHEAIGRVVALGGEPGDDRSSLQVGDRVAIEPLIWCGTCYACREGSTNCCVDLVVQGVHADGGLRELTVVETSKLHPIGDLPTRAAVLTEPVTIALQALSRADRVRRRAVGEHDDVLIVGAGPIGLVTAVACLDRGARVHVVDREPRRLDRARALGVTTVANSDEVDVTAWIRDLTSGDGPAVVVEATGVASLLRNAIDQVAPSGTVVVLGMSDQDLQVPLTWFTRKEVVLVGSRTSVDKFGAAVELVRAQADRLETLVSHTFALDDAAEAIAFAMAHPDEVCKVAVVL